MLESPYFEPRVNTTEDANEFNHEFDVKAVGPALFSLQDATTSSGAESSSRNEQDITNRASESYSSEISSPGSGRKKKS